MSQPGDQNPEKPLLPENFNVGDFETSTQSMLRDGYAGIGALNRNALDNFDPSGLKVHEDIELRTAYKELEAVEPEFGRTLRDGMLRDLGLSFQKLEANDPNYIYQQEHSGGSFSQIRTIQRTDGVAVPIFIATESPKQGGDVTGIRLLSHDEARIIHERLETKQEGRKLDARLRDEFGLEQQFLDFSLTLRDKRDMLAAYDAVQKLEVATPDQNELKKIRNKLARNMLPRLDIATDFGSEEKAEVLAENYAAQLKHIIRHYDLTSEQAQELKDSEQLLRLAALNKQLKTRRRITKAGAIAAASTLAAGGATLGVFDAAIHNPDDMLSEGLIGGAVGFVFSTPIIGATIRRLRRTRSGFSQQPSSVRREISDQLASERTLARAYGHVLKHG